MHASVGKGRKEKGSFHSSRQKSGGGGGGISESFFGVFWDFLGSLEK